MDELEHVEEHAGDVEEEKKTNNDDQYERQVHVTLHLLLSDEQIYLKNLKFSKENDTKLQLAFEQSLFTNPEFSSAPPQHSSNCPLLRG